MKVKGEWHFCVFATLPTHASLPPFLHSAMWSHQTKPKCIRTNQFNCSKNLSHFGAQQILQMKAKINFAAHKRRTVICKRHSVCICHHIQSNFFFITLGTMILCTNVHAHTCTIATHTLTLTPKFYHYLFSSAKFLEIELWKRIGIWFKQFQLQPNGFAIFCRCTRC